MSNRVVVPCDNCKKKFVVKKPKKKLHKDGLEGSLTIYYISCPHCKKKTVSFVENEKIKKLIAENGKLQKRLGFIRDDDEYIKALEQFEKNVSRIDRLKRDLIFRFSKYV